MLQAQLEESVRQQFHDLKLFHYISRQTWQQSERTVQTRHAVSALLCSRITCVAKAYLGMQTLHKAAEM